jgi:antibiotic biosynthesis monooxygenase (ABM) superfamily enzyme
MISASSRLDVHETIPVSRQEVSIPPQPARWKMALVLWMIVFPAITGLGVALTPVLKGQSGWVRNLVITAISQRLVRIRSSIHGDQ